MDTINQTSPLTLTERQRLDKLEERNTRQRETWKKHQTRFYKKHFFKGGELDDATVEANLEKRRAYFRSKYVKKRPSTIHTEEQTEEEKKIARRKLKRQEYNARAYARKKELKEEQS
jgi:hypothetical protein